MITLKSVELEETWSLFLPNMQCPGIDQAGTQALGAPSETSGFWFSGPQKNRSEGGVPLLLCFGIDGGHSSVLSTLAGTSHMTLLTGQAGKSVTAKELIEKKSCPWPRIVKCFCFFWFFLYLLWIYKFFKKISLSENICVTFLNFLWGAGG